METIKFVAFGDSNINILGALKTKNFDIYKFSGISMKSIVNKTEHYDKIVNILKKGNYDCAFFLFGVVDVNFYYYYKKYKKNEEDVENKMYEYTKEYVKLIDELNVKNKYILGILPSHIFTEDFKEALQVYGTLTENECEKINIDDIEMVSRNNRVKNMNSIIRKECKKTKSDITFCNIYDYVTENDKLKDIFYLKHNPCNIHQVYEYLLLVYLKKCLNFLLKYYNYRKLIKSMEYNFNNYFKDACARNNKSCMYEQNKFDINKINKVLDNI